jgi:hypothetical protein
MVSLAPLDQAEDAPLPGGSEHAAPPGQEQGLIREEMRGCILVLLARRAPEIKPTVIEAQRLYTYDREKYFEILDMPREELDDLAGTVAAQVRERCFKG